MRVVSSGFSDLGESAASQAVHRVIQDVAAERVKAGGGYWRSVQG